MIKTRDCLFAVLVVLSPVHAAPGDLDPVFGVGGKVVTFGDTRGANCGGMAIQDDGKIVVAGDFGTIIDGAYSAKKIAVVRYTASGELDTSFGTGGTMTTAFGTAPHITCMALQQDGKIIAAGYAMNADNDDFAVANGFIDLTQRGAYTHPSYEGLRAPRTATGTRRQSG